MVAVTQSPLNNFMKTVSLQKFAANFAAPSRGSAPANPHLRTAVLAALSAVENAKQLCMMAGQMLLDEKSTVEHGDFQAHIAKLIPEISYETCRVWMRAAANIVKALPAVDFIDVEVVSISQILSSPEEKLTPDQRIYKQAWLDFTADKSIRQCLDSVTIYGEPAHNVDRAVNGKTKGGKGSDAAPDRKAFEKFTATKLGHITTFLTVTKKSAASGQKQVVGWRELSPVQRNAIGAAFTNSLEKWPQWLLDILADKIKTELKMSDAQRLTR